MALPLRNSRIKLPIGQVFWREVGQGPTLVFLHGSWNDSSQWLPLIQQLSQDYHCCAPDLLGFGDSERSPHHHSIQLEVECLHDYIEALHLPQVYLIGHSLGGWIAASYALKQPERVQGLILLAPEGVQPEGQRLSTWWMRCLVARPSLAAGILRLLRPLTKLLGRHQAIDRALARRQLLLTSPTACQILLKRRRSEIQAELLQERLEWLKVPTLILQGENDVPEAIAGSRLYAERAPEAQFISLENAGNDLPETSPDWVAQHIREFVNGH